MADTILSGGAYWMRIEAPDNPTRTSFDGPPVKNSPLTSLVILDDVTVLPILDDDLILGPVGDDTLFGGADTASAWLGEFVRQTDTHLAARDSQPDTETIIYGGKLWRRVIVGSLVVRIGETPRICIEYEPV